MPSCKLDEKDLAKIQKNLDFFPKLYTVRKVWAYFALCDR